MSEGEVLKGAGELVRAATEGRRAEKSDLREVAGQNGDLDAASSAQGANLAVWELLRFRGTSLIAWLTGTLDRKTLRELEDRLREKIAQIPENRRQQPKANVAVPAIEALAYSWDEDALREMYLNLIQRAADSTTADSVHPSFVDIIRHLSAAEAPVLDTVLRGRQWPAARLSLSHVTEPNCFRMTPIVLNLTDDEAGAPAPFPQLPLWAANWQRLGLVELDWDSSLEPIDAADQYAYVGQRPEWLAIQKPFAPGFLPAREDAEAWNPDFDRGVLRSTALGLDFLRVVRPTRPEQTGLALEVD